MLFQAVSKTVTVIAWSASSGSRLITTGLVTGSSVVDDPTPVVPLSELYVIV